MATSSYESWKMRALQELEREGELSDESTLTLGKNITWAIKWNEEASNTDVIEKETMGKENVKRLSAEYRPQHEARSK